MDSFRRYHCRMGARVHMVASLCQRYEDLRVPAADDTRPGRLLSEADGRSGGGTLTLSSPAAPFPFALSHSHLHWCTGALVRWCTRAHVSAFWARGSPSAARDRRGSRGPRGERTHCADARAPGQPHPQNAAELFSAAQHTHSCIQPRNTFSRATPSDAPAPSAISARRKTARDKDSRRARGRQLGLRPRRAGRCL